MIVIDFTSFVNSELNPIYRANAAFINLVYHHTVIKLYLGTGLRDDG